MDISTTDWPETGQNSDKTSWRHDRQATETNGNTRDSCQYSHGGNPLLKSSRIDDRRSKKSLSCWICCLVWLVTFFINYIWIIPPLDVGATEQRAHSFTLHVYSSYIFFLIMKYCIFNSLRLFRSYLNKQILSTQASQWHILHLNMLIIMIF